MRSVFVQIMVMSMALASACSRSGPPAPPAPEGSASAVVAGERAGSEAGSHDEHDCRTAHPSKPRERAAATAVLSAAAAREVQSVRMMTHQTSMRLRRDGDGWLGLGSCPVKGERVRDLLKNLQKIEEAPTTAVPSASMPVVRVVFVGKDKRLYHLDVFQRIGEKDIVGLDGGERREVTGLQRELLNPKRSLWCKK